MKKVALKRIGFYSDEIPMVYDLGQGLIRLAIVCLLTVGVSSSVHGAEPCAEAVVRSWTARVETIEDHLKLILSLLKEHPDLVTANLQYRRSLLDVYSHVPELQKALGDKFAGLEIHGPKTVSLKYAKSAEGMVYDERAIGVFRQDRVNDLKALRLPDPNVQTMTDVLRQFVAQSTDAKGIFEPRTFKQQLDSLLRVAPFLFDSSGRTKFKSLSKELARLESEISESTPSALENHYGDFYKEHLGQIVVSAAGSLDGVTGQVTNRYERVREMLVKGELRRALTKIPRPKDMLGPPPEIRALSIETLPAAVGMVRGCYGADCSIKSVPFGPMLRDVKVHFIRLGEDPNSRPDGYAFSVLAEVNGKKIPYIITINGPMLAKSDVEMVRKMVAEDYGANEVLVPDMQKNPHLTNTRDARDGMSEGANQRVEAKLPEGWEVIDAYTKEKKSEGFANYYAAENLETAYLVKLAPDSRVVGGEAGILKSTLEFARYQPSADLKKVPMLERAILGAQTLAGDDGKMAPRVLSALGLKIAQIEAVKPILELTSTRGLKVAEYKRLKESGIGFNLTDLFKYDLSTRVKTLRTLFEDPEGAKLLAEYRGSKDPRFLEAMEAAFTKRTPGLAIEILLANKLPAEKTLSLLVAARESLTHMDIEKASKFSALARGAPLEKQVQILGRRYIKTVLNDIAVSRQLGRALGKGSPNAKRFALEIIQDRELANSNRIVKAFREMVELEPELARTPNPETLSRAVTKWVQSEKTDVVAKAEIIKATHGSGEGDVFGELLKRVPKSQQNQLISFINKSSDILHFRRLAEAQKVLSDFAKNATAESFEFRPVIMPGQKKTFTMGSQIDEGEREVTLTRPHSAAQTPVTQGMYKLLMNAEPSRFKHDAAGKEVPVLSRERINLPVEQVNWDDAQAYLKKLGMVTGRKYRLPSEAEYENLQRAGTKTIYSFGDDASELPEHAHFVGNSGERTHSVGELKPNAFGLQDVVGNVWGWCEDWYGPIPTGKPLVDPVGPPSAPLSMGSHRVIRGGSWDSIAQRLRSSGRSKESQQTPFHGIGFRLLRVEP